MTRPPRTIVGTWVALYLILAIITGDWLRALVVFPAVGLYWVFLMFMVQRRPRAPR